MSEQNEFYSLLRVMIQNFIFMFLMTGALGFSLSAAGILTPENDIYMFTLTFSSLWGFVGAAAAWSRDNADIQAPAIFHSFLESIGLEVGGSSSILYKIMVVRKSFAKRIFIPFVTVPEM